MCDFDLVSMICLGVVLMLWLVRCCVSSCCNGGSLSGVV